MHRHSEHRPHRRPSGCKRVLPAQQPSRSAASLAFSDVQVIRSPRRRRTVSARLVGSRLEVRIPATMSAADERAMVDRMVRRWQLRAERQHLNGTQELSRRAEALNRRYFDGQLRITSAEYVTNQEQRYGSCSVNGGRIRISHRVATMPVWVRDYVLMHELAHLVEPNHTRAFWRLVGRYPWAERARGYLMAVGLEALAAADPLAEAAQQHGAAR